MRHPVSTVVLLVAAGCLTAPGRAGPRPSALPPDDEIAAQVRALADAAVARPMCVGLSVSVSRDDEIVIADGFGLAEIEHGVQADAETMFRIGSVTKQYTAAAIMTLAERGEIDLDACMTTYLPEYPLGERVVTVRQLLAHTSGIKSYTSLGDRWQRVVSRELTDAEILELFENEPFDFEPDTDWRYNNSGYYLLGMIIEAVSGRPWHDELAETFFTPLGLTRTRVGSNVDVIPNRAQGYAVSDGVLVNDRLIGMNQPGGAGALIASARDLIAWQLALVNGRVVSPASYEAMRTPHVLADGTDHAYGYGLMVQEVAGRRCVMHGGGIFGFNSMLLYLPDDRLGIAVISNSEAYDSGRLARSIARELLGNAVTTLPVPDDLAGRITGSYAFEEIALTVALAVEDGRLVGRGTDGSELRFEYVGDGTFRAEADPGMRLSFDPSGEGPMSGFVLHQGGGRLMATRTAEPPGAP